MAILQGAPRSADVICLTDCELVLLRAAPFQALLHQEPRLALALARLEARRLQNLNRRFVQRESSAAARLLQVLEDLATRTAPEAPPTAPIPPLPQRELAALSGLARETASRTLVRLRRQGLVEQMPGGRLRLVNGEQRGGGGGRAARPQPPARGCAHSAGQRGGGGCHGLSALIAGRVGSGFWQPLQSRPHRIV
jgi:hypothetical protein